MTNPLLDFTGLPRFDQIRPDHVAPAMDHLLTRADAALDAVTAPDFAAQWDAIAGVLDVATEQLGRAWGAVGHLNSVADTPELRAAFNAVLPKVTDFWTRLGADERLYAKYKAIDPASLNPEQRQAHRNALRNFVLGGAELTGEARERFARIQERQAELAQKFSENALDATDSFAYFAAETEMDGVPDDVTQAARAAAAAEGREGCKLTLKMPCYLPVMQFATSSALRERLYRAYVTRASDQAEGEAARFDNSALIREILELRQEEARLLGYGNFAEVSVVPKMAESPHQVIRFLRDLARRARPFAERDVADLRDFAAQQLDLSDPQPWDWPYISEKLKEARYAFSEQDVKQYFTAPRVLAGLFKIIETLFEVAIRPDTAPVWHPSVQFFRIERDGHLVGQFYLDQPARNGKRGGAWMDDVRARWLRPDTGTLQTPVAHLVCNFADGVDGKPPLLTHDDVTTLFHEFGHGLHHLLTRVIAAKNFQSGMQTLRQIEFALFDMLLHAEHDPARDFMPLLDLVRAEVAVLRPPAYSRTAHTFSHIFAGGYAAGYYSYKWAEVLSADAYAAFEETSGNDSLPNPETGRKYRQEILEAGGSRPAMESFKAFRGREPSLDALLRHQGMA